MDFKSLPELNYRETQKIKLLFEILLGWDNHQKKQCNEACEYCSSPRHLDSRRHSRHVRRR